MKHTLKLRDSDHRIINRGRTHSGCLWTRKSTTGLMLFPFVIIFLVVALSDVMTWFFYNTCKYDEVDHKKKMEDGV